MSDINQLRNKMDDITIEMIRMLKARTDIAKEIGKIKKSTGKRVTDEHREESLRSAVLEMSNKLGLDESAASKFLNFLLNESVKVQSEGKQSHLSIFRRAKSLEQNGRKMIHMEVGEPDFEPPKPVQDALRQACEKGLFRYGQAGGMPAFRQALADHISKRFNFPAKPENILASPGARFSVFSAITALLNPGDEMIIIEPAWPAYKDCAMHAGVKVRAVRTALDGRWEPAPEQIKNMINPNTKMIVLNYPNNPTGKILPERLQDEIVKTAQDHGLYILSDEIYSEYAYADWKSVLQYNYDKSIITQSFSKSHAMTGFRIGYAVSSRSIIDKMTKIGELCLTNVPEIIQHAAMRALEHDVKGNAQIVKGRLDILAEKARDMGLDFINPDGAMYLYAKINCGGIDGVTLADSLLDRGLAIAPGEGFGDYGNFIRISACQDKNILMQGMNILDGRLRELR